MRVCQPEPASRKAATTSRSKRITPIEDRGFSSQHQRTQRNPWSVPIITLAETRANLSEAVELVLEANCALAEELMLGHTVIREALLALTNQKTTLVTQFPWNYP